MADEPPSIFPRGTGTRRPLSPSPALPGSAVCIQSVAGFSCIAGGAIGNAEISGGRSPASISATRHAGSSDSTQYDRPTRGFRARPNTAGRFVEAAVAAGIPKGDYNGRNRGAAVGVASLTQYTMRDGRRSSTYQAFLAGEPEQRPNLTIITAAQATRVLLNAA